MADTTQGLVQESGRAGRDGCAAAHVVYYNTQERDRVLDHLRKDTERIQIRAGVKRSLSESSLEGNDIAFNNNDKHAAKARNQIARIESFRKVIRYCESTSRCRHHMIKEMSGDLELHSDSQPSSICDYACDFCKEGQAGVSLRKSRMVAPSPPEDTMDMSLAPYMCALFPELYRGLRSVPF